MDVSLYDLAALDDADAIEAWLGGASRPGWPTLAPADRKRLLGSWWFLARPGQKWEPGREFITRIEAGRGFGKNFAFSNTMLDAADDPERWGGMAIVVGASPAETLKYSAISRALWCFPGLAAPAALQAYRVAAAAPHVRTIVADVRALEAIDVLEHRSMVRDMLVRTAKRAGERMENVVEDADFARLALAQVGTLKALMDLDALKAPPIPADDAPPPENGERTGDHLKALLRRTHDDLASRRKDMRTLPLIESTAGDAPSGETC